MQMRQEETRREETEETRWTWKLQWRAERSLSEQQEVLYCNKTDSDGSLTHSLAQPQSHIHSDSSYECSVCASAGQYSTLLHV